MWSYFFLNKNQFPHIKSDSEVPHSFLASSNCYIDLVQTQSIIFVSISTKILFCLFQFRIVSIWRRRRRFLRNIHLLTCEISLKTSPWDGKFSTASISPNNWVIKRNSHPASSRYQEDFVSPKVVEDPGSLSHPFADSLLYKELSRTHCLSSTLYIYHIYYILKSYF